MNYKMWAALFTLFFFTGLSGQIQAQNLPAFAKILPPSPNISANENGSTHYLEAIKMMRKEGAKFDLKNGEIELKNVNADKFLYDNENFFTYIKTANGKSEWRFILDYDRGFLHEKPSRDDFLFAVYLHALKACHTKTGEEDRVEAVEQGLALINNFMQAGAYQDRRLMTTDIDLEMQALRIMLAAVKTVKNPSDIIKEQILHCKKLYSDNWMSKAFETDLICGRDAYEKITQNRLRISDFVNPVSKEYKNAIGKYKNENYLETDRQNYDSFMMDAIKKMQSGKFDEIQESTIADSDYILAKRLCTLKPTIKQRLETQKYIFAVLSSMGM